MKELKARDIMSRDIHAVSATMTVREAAVFLVNREISGAPVEDDKGELVGVLSFTDIVRSASEGGGGLGSGDHAFYTGRWEEETNREDLGDIHFEDDTRVVSEIMTPVVLAVDAYMPISEVANSMLSGHLHRLLVTDESRVVGIVSTSDLLRILATS